LRVWPQYVEHPMLNVDLFSNLVTSFGLHYRRLILLISTGVVIMHVHAILTGAAQWPRS
jgi:hypothetical protein